MICPKIKSNQFKTTLINIYESIKYEIFKKSIQKSVDESIISKASTTMLYNIVILLYYDFKNHKDEYNEIINNINLSFISMNGVTTKFAPCEYYNMLYEENIHSNERYQYYINRVIYEYDDIQKKDISIETIRKQLENIYEIMATELSNGNYIEIEDYLSN